MSEQENTCKHPHAEPLSYCPDCDEFMGLTLALPEEDEEDREGDNDWRYSSDDSDDRR